MKYRFLIYALLAPVTASFVLADYPDTILSETPLVYYRFEEPAGATTIADSSGNSLGGVTTGAVAFETTGLFGNAGAFLGDASILSELTLDPSIGDFSVEAIIRPTLLGGTQVFVANQDGVGLGRSNLIVLNDGIFRSFIGGAGTDTEPVLQLDTWYHVILTYDRSGADLAETTVRLYVDGALLGSSTAIAEFADGGWVIGAHKLQDNSFFNGEIDEFSMFGKRLDDPDGDGDESDSVVGDHYKEFLTAADVLVSFETDTTFVRSGESATLSWFVSPALTALTIDDGSGPVDVLSDTVDCVGTRVVSPIADTTYTLSGTSPAGMETLELSIVVDAPPVIDTFASNLSEVQAGGSVVLSWAVRNAVSVEIDKGVGIVDPGSGTAVAILNSDTTYTLTATNPNGSVTAQVSVTTTSGSPPPIAHWRVGEAPGETDGTILIGEGDTMFDGTFVGSPAFDSTDPAPVPDGSTASIVFDGVSSVDILAWTGVPGTSARTVAFWFKGPVSQPTNNATIVSWGSGATGERFDTRVSNNNRNGTMRVEVAGSGRDSSLFIADDSWHHVALVIIDNGAPNIGEALFYVDGVLDGAAVGGATAINTADTQTVRLGNANLFARPLTGKLDDVRIYDRALSADEIVALIESSVELEITSIRILENGFIEIRWNGQPGEYSVEYSFDLESWLELDDPSIPAGETSAVTVDSFIGTQPENTRVYYRVSEQE